MLAPRGDAAFICRRLRFSIPDVVLTAALLEWPRAERIDVEAIR
jgi:hypothetical protein